MRGNRRGTRRAGHGRLLPGSARQTPAAPRPGPRRLPGARGRAPHPRPGQRRVPAPLQPRHCPRAPRSPPGRCPPSPRPRSFLLPLPGHGCGAAPGTHGPGGAGPGKPRGAIPELPRPLRSRWGGQIGSSQAEPEMAPSLLARQPRRKTLSFSHRIPPGSVRQGPFSAGEVFGGLCFRSWKRSLGEGSGAQV